MPQFECELIEYLNQSFVRFKQKFPFGVENTQRNSTVVASSFPSFYINSNFGFLSYGGDMTGDTDRKMGVWNGLPGQINDGMQGGPLILFQSNGESLILSPMSNFMSASMEYVPLKGGYINFGVMGAAEFIPKDYEVDFIVYFSGNGVNQVRKKHILSNF